LSSYLHTSPLGVAIKGATSFSTQENSVFLWMLAALAALAASPRSPLLPPLSLLFHCSFKLIVVFFAAVTVAAATVAIAVIVASVTAPSPLL
jgi:hypothetical protein